MIVENIHEPSIRSKSSLSCLEEISDDEGGHGGNSGGGRAGPNAVRRRGGAISTLYSDNFLNGGGGPRAGSGVGVDRVSDTSAGTSNGGYGGGGPSAGGCIGVVGGAEIIDGVGCGLAGCVGGGSLDIASGNGGNQGDVGAAGGRETGDVGIEVGSGDRVAAAIASGCGLGAVCGGASSSDSGIIGRARVEYLFDGGGEGAGGRGVVSAVAIGTGYSGDFLNKSLPCAVRGGGVQAVGATGCVGGRGALGLGSGRGSGAEGVACSGGGRRLRRIDALRQ